MPSLKRFFFGSPLRSHKKTTKYESKALDQTVSEDSLKETVDSISRDDEEDDDDYRTTVMDVSNSYPLKEKQPIAAQSASDGDDDDDDEGEEEPWDDFRTTVMDSYPSKIVSLEKNNSRKTSTTTNNTTTTSSTTTTFGRTIDPQQSPFHPHKSMATERLLLQSNTTKSPINELPCIIATRHIGSEDDEDDTDEDFDDIRSTISGLTEATGYVTTTSPRSLSSPSPSPTNSSNTNNNNNNNNNRAMHDFLKNETEAILQLLSTVESGDEDSTVVEESVRGANQAEQMAREMELEMEKLVGQPTTRKEECDDNQEQHQHHALTIDCQNDNDNDNDDNDNDDNDEHRVPVSRPPPPATPVISPESTEFLADIRSVIHPVSDTSIQYYNHGVDDDTKSCSSYGTRRSSSSYRRDLFRKRSSLYKLKQNEKALKLKNKRQTKRRKRMLIGFFLSVVLVLAGFVSYWNYHHPDKTFSDTIKDTSADIHSQLKHRVVPIAFRAKEIALDRIRSAASFALNHANIYAPLARNRTLDGIRTTKSYLSDRLLLANGFFRNSNGLVGSIGSYLKDTLEYTFTDRAERERRVQEEQRLEELLAAAAAAAAAKEAADHQQQLWTQTIVAGACAFAGSVATNVLWAALG